MLMNKWPVLLFLKKEQARYPTFWHGPVILAWNMDTAWMWSWSALPTLSMNKAVRLFSFYFPNALQGTVTEMCNILVIALCLTPQKLSSEPKAALCACSMLISKKYMDIGIFYIFRVSSCQSGSNFCGKALRECSCLIVLQSYNLCSLL